MSVVLFFACCDVVHPLHKLVGQIMHIISMKFQSVYPLLYYGKIKLFCTGFRQIWQGVYKPVEWFFACFDVVHPLHNLVGPMMHIISMKFQCLPSLYYGKIKLFCTGLRQGCLHACRVVFCLLWCCASFAQTCRANNAHNFSTKEGRHFEISLKLCALLALQDCAEGAQHHNKQKTTQQACKHLAKFAENLCKKF